MGIHDREYMSDDYKKGGIGNLSIVVWLLIINLAVYLVQHGFFDNNISNQLNVSKDTLLKGQIWRLLTFQFSHSDGGHFLSNMIGLFIFGRMLQQVINHRYVVPIYLFGGLIGAILQILWGFLFGHAPLIGASASVLALAMALCTLIPEQRLSLLFLPFQFKVKYLGWFILAMNVLGLLASIFDKKNNIGYMSHIGGMAAGWIFIKYIFPNVKFSPSPHKPKKQKKQEPRRSKITEAAEEEIQKKRKKETVYLNKRVDSILEKINAHGMQSLTDEERIILERSSEKYRRDGEDS